MFGLKAKHSAIAAAAALSVAALASPAAAADLGPIAQPFAPGAFETVSPAQVFGDTSFEHHGKKKYRKGKKYKRHHSRYDRHGRYDDRYDQRVRYDTRVWRGRDGRAYCRRDDGTTGLLIGAGVGALIGNEIAGRGDRTLGAILGAAGGALLGREIDRSGYRCR